MSSAATPPLERAVVRRAQKVPLPTRLLGAAFLFATLSLVLHAMPRPYQAIPFFVVRSLGDGYDDTRATIHAAEDTELIAGEASKEERRSYRWELWRHAWLGTVRELVLRVASWLAALCLGGSGVAAFVRWRKSSEEMLAAGARTKPETLRVAPIVETPAPIVLPGKESPRLPGEPPKPIRVERQPAFEDAPTPAPEGGIDPALAKLGFSPHPSIGSAYLDDDDEDEDDGGKKSGAPNLASKVGPGLARAPATPAALPKAAVVPKELGIEEATGSRPIVRPGAPPPSDTAEPAVEKTVERTVSSPEATVVSPIAPEPNANPSWWPKPDGS